MNDIKNSNNFSPYGRMDEKNYPKISIVTPSYNQGQYLEETIRSVLLQDYPNLEYIIIDGGSTDNSVEIIKKYESYLAYWVSEPDEGQTSAINKGFRRATGDIIAWINSDDLYVEGAFHKVAERFKQNPQFSVIYGNCIFFKEDEPEYIYKPGTFNEKRLIAGDYIAQPSIFFSRHVIEETGYLDERFHFSLDYDLLMRLSSIYEIEYVDETFSKFRYHDASKTISQRFHFLPENFIIMEKALKRDKLDIKTRYIIFKSIFNMTLKTQQILYYLNLTAKEIQSTNYQVDGRAINGNDVFFHLMHYKLLPETTVSKVDKQELLEIRENITSIFNYLSEYYPNQTLNHSGRLHKDCIHQQSFELLHYIFDNYDPYISRQFFLLLIKADKKLLFCKSSIRYIIKYLVTKRGLELYHSIKKRLKDE